MEDDENDARLRAATAHLVGRCESEGIGIVRCRDGHAYMFTSGWLRSALEIAEAAGGRMVVFVKHGPDVVPAAAS